VTQLPPLSRLVGRISIFMPLVIKPRTLAFLAKAERRKLGASYIVSATGLFDLARSDVGMIYADLRRANLNGLDCDTVMLNEASLSERDVRSLPLARADLMGGRLGADGHAG
jgi:hypothetical protein